jgi:hypothetical protein
VIGLAGANSTGKIVGLKSKELAAAAVSMSRLSMASILTRRAEGGRLIARFVDLCWRRRGVNDLSIGVFILISRASYVVVRLTGL